MYCPLQDKIKSPRSSFSSTLESIPTQGFIIITGLRGFESNRLSGWAVVFLNIFKEGYSSTDIKDSEILLTSKY